MKFVRKTKLKISGVCEVNKKWLKLQFVDEWGDEDRIYISHDDWKKLGKPWLGDSLIMELSRSEF